MASIVMTKSDRWVLLPQLSLMAHTDRSLIARWRITARLCLAPIRCPAVTKRWTWLFASHEMEAFIETSNASCLYKQIALAQLLSAAFY